ncbi:MAG TPA: 30S ribosomal protein S8 [Clostridiales bacterium]|nr:30S ribosomal protein S8 [Clostridiales bacterium]
MAMSDPVADMLTRIRNATLVRRERVEVPGSRLKRAMAEIMKREGYIRDFEWVAGSPENKIRIHLRYGPRKELVINGLKRVSKPGLRVYAGKEELPRVLGGLGTAIVSTSRGLMTDREARELGLGGEVICHIW